MDLDFNELRQLVTALDQTDVAELILKNEQFELTLRKYSAVASALSLVEPAPVTALASSSSPSSTKVPVDTLPVVDAPSTAAPIVDPNLLEITSPMVGTFYRSPAPDEPSFVNVGDRIQTGQTVCIIEAMKLMNELEAEVAGEVVEVLVENAEPVEFGQILMRVKPN